jgi:protein-disulfide isomerase/uncharacterized membrane protein
MTKEKTSGLISLPLTTLGSIASLISLYSHFVYATKGAGHSTFCTLSATINCDAINASEWSSIVGIPTALLAFGFFEGAMVISVALLVTGSPILLSVLTLLSWCAFGASLFFGSISFFTLKTLCLSCAAIYLVSFLWALSLLSVKTERRFLQRIEEGIASLIKAPFTVSHSSTLQRVASRWILTGVTSAFFTSVCAYFAFSLFFPPSVIAPPVTGSTSSSYNESPPEFEEEPLPLSNEEVQEQVEKWKIAKEETISLRSGDASFRELVENDVGSIDIVEFSDFECPACRRMAPVLEKLSKKHRGLLRIIYKQFPLDSKCNPHVPQPMHEFACVAASLARCGSEYGKLKESLTYLYSFSVDETINAERLIERFNDSVGIAKDKIDECISSNRHSEKIRQDIEEGARLGLEGTPTLFINRKKVPSSPSFEVLDSIIEYAKAH